MRVWFVGLALVAALVCSAQAADWSGLYGGMNFGAGDGSADVANPYRNIAFTESTNAKGPLWGVQGGYGFQDGHLVYGVEAMADIADLTGTATCLSGPQIGRCRPQMNALGTLTGRLGYADGANLFYAKAGLGWMADREQYLLFNITPAAAEARQDRLGWVVGAGLEHRIATQWSLRLDYQYLGFDYQTFHLATPGDLAFAAHQHVFTMGVNYYLDAAASDDDAAATLSSPDTPAGDWAFEITGRLSGATGNQKKDFSYVPNNENSRLNYQGMPMLAGEIVARADHASGWFVEGNTMAGSISGGNLYDEDTPNADFGNGRYSNTITRISKGSFAYQGASAGFNVIDRDDLRLGVLAGYGHLRTKTPGFGCTQIANNDYNCLPVGFFAPSYNIVTETDDWHAAKLGVSSRIALLDGLSLNTEAAYLPYVFLHGIDHHNFRNIVFNAHGVGDGMQLESSLDYALSDSLSLGVGARYWEYHVGSGSVACQYACDDNVNQIYNDPAKGTAYDFHMFGGFAQLTYRIGRIAHHDDNQPAPDDSAFDWARPYAGIQGGIRASQSLWHTDCVAVPCDDYDRNFNTVPLTSGAGYLGLVGGILQTVAPDWLLGVEADAGWANNNRSEKNIWIAYLPAGNVRPDDLGGFKQTWDGSLRLRGGYLVRPSTLAYATMGLALEGVSAYASCHGAPSNWCFVSHNETTTGTQIGFTLGAGLETALSDSLSARLEYRYTDAGTFRHSFFASAPLDQVTMAADTRDQRMLLGLIWRP